MKRIALFTVLLALVSLVSVALADNLTREGSVWKYTVGNTTYTVTPFAATDTIVGKTTTDTLTNKTLSGATISGSSTVTGNTTLDDGSGDSPSLILKDEEDFTATLVLTNGTSFLSTTLSNAAGAVNILTGNLKVGNGTPGVAQNGEDAYIEGTFEVDGSAQFDGAITANSTITGAGNVTLDDGSGNSPSIVLQDEENQTATLSLVNGTSYLSIALSNASGAANVTTGNLQVGNGVPNTTLDGEDAYIEGTLEVDGALNFDGAADFASTITGAGNVTLDDGSGASPSLILTDQADETLTVLKSNGGNITATISNATESVQFTTGNLRVGNGANDTTLDGEDAYVEGTLEVDGALNFDSNMDLAGFAIVGGVLNANGAITLGNASTDNITVTGSIVGNTIFEGTTANTNAVTMTFGEPAESMTTCAGGPGCSEIVTSANVITATECGKSFFINSTTGFASTLPAISAVPANCVFDFVVSTVPTSGNHTIITGNSLENVLEGSVYNGAGVDTQAAGDTITMAQDTTVLGDMVRIITDGIKYYFRGNSGAATGMSVSQAD